MSVTIEQDLKEILGSINQKCKRRYKRIKRLSESPDLDVNRHLGNSFNRNSYSLYYSPFSSIIIRVCGKKFFLGAGCGVWGVGFYRF